MTNVEANLPGAGPSRISKAPSLAIFALIFVAVSAGAPSFVQAGGREFAGGGTRGLGRGGASFLRADDPYVLVLNPALLADLPDDMALISVHLPLTAGAGG